MEECKFNDHTDLNTEKVLLQLAGCKFFLFVCKKGLTTCHLFLAIGESCQEIKAKQPSYPDGHYAINATRIGVEYITVYCRMALDGGMNDIFVLALLSIDSFAPFLQTIKLLGGGGDESKEPSFPLLASD